MPQSSKAFLDSDLERERKKKKNTHSRCIDSLRIVVDDSRQAKVRYFTHKVAVDEYVPCSQISMDVSHVGEIPHSCCNAPQHSHQLDDCELTIMFLKKKRKSDILAEGSEGHKSGAAPTRDFFFFWRADTTLYLLSCLLWSLYSPWGIRLTNRSPCTRWQSWLVFLEEK